MRVIDERNTKTVKVGEVAFNQPFKLDSTNSLYCRVDTNDETALYTTCEGMIPVFNFCNGRLVWLEPDEEVRLVGVEIHIV